MMNLNKILLAGLVLAACGDDAAKTPDAMHDGPKGIDAFVAPAPPALGAQVDRLGRPTINTALNHTFDTTAAKGPAKDAYNADGASGSWKTNATYLGQFAGNLAILDAVDTGLGVPNAGCGNAIAYDASKTGTAAYGGLASLLADDQLYTDTAKGTCNLFLALEVEVATGGAVAHTSCGGRAPTYDVIDAVYSAVAAGLSGFDTSLQPLVHDGAVVHTDVSDSTFPFLGAPH